MPRTEAANQRIRAEQRAKILAAARKEFARKGMSATMADIAATAGVSQGLAYRYFDNKEAIFAEVVKLAQQSGQTAMQRLQEIPATPIKRLEILVARMLEARLERHEYIQFIIKGLNDEGTDENTRELLRQQIKDFQSMLRQLIIEGQASGEVAPGDPDQLVMAINACINGLSTMALRQPEQAKEHLPDAAIILRMLKS